MPNRLPSSQSLLLLCAALSAPAVHAVGLGEIVSQSAIGQPLRVEIRLTGDHPERAEGCIRLLPERVKPADGIPGITRARIAIRRSGKEAVAVVTDPSPANHPIMRLRLEEACDSQLQREYVLLLPSPLEITPPARPPVPAARAPTPPEARPARQAKGYAVWTARGGETLAALAARRYPEAPAARARFVRRVQQANPDLFGTRGAGPRTRLAAGTQLLVPRQQAVQSRVPAARPRPPVSGEAPRPPATPAAKVDQVVVEGREPASGEALKLARRMDFAAARPASEDERDLMRREQQAQATVSEQIATQAEVSQRLRKLEALQAELRAQVLEDADKAAPPTPAVPAAVPRPPRAQSPAWPALLILFAGAGVAAGLWAWRRRSARAVPMAAPAPVREPAAEARAMPPKHLPPEPRNIGPAAPAPEAAALAWEIEALPPLSSPMRRAENAAPAWQVDPPRRELHPAAREEVAPLDWEAPPSASIAVDFDLAENLRNDELLAEHDSVIELAEIMLSFGRIQGATETLEEFIRIHPTRSVAPWVKLLEVYRAADMRPEFDALSQRLNQTFNVVSITWDNFEEAMRVTPARLEDMPHLMDRIEGLWGRRECLQYMDKLLRDNREGSRQGFAIGVADDLLTLLAVLDYRLRLEKLEPAAP